jgi:hypothetical protein
MSPISNISTMSSVSNIVEINKKKYTVNEDEFIKLETISKYCFLVIKKNVGYYERLSSLLIELKTIDISINTLVFISPTHGGFMPILCSKHFKHIYIFDCEEKHKTNIQENILNHKIKNINIINNLNSIQNKKNMIIINENLIFDNINFIIENNAIFLSTQKKYYIKKYNEYKLTNTEVNVYIPKKEEKAFIREFKYFVYNELLNYDNLIHLCVMVKDGGDEFKKMLIDNYNLIDRWTILDTGSTDNTIEIINEILVGKKKGNLYQEPFIDFGTSRNRCIELAGDVCKFILMLDDTYVVTGKGREFINFVRDDQYADSFSFYIKSDDVEYTTNRLIKTDRKNLRYLFKIHEVITPKNNINVIIPIDDVIIQDNRSEYMENRTMSRKESDLKLLFQEIQDSPDNPRHYYYVAQTYNVMNKHNEALEYFLKRYYHPDPKKVGFIQEKYDAIFEAARICNFKLDKSWEECKKYYEYAYELDNERPESLYFLGIHYYLNSLNTTNDIERTNKQIAYDYFKKAYEIGYPLNKQYSLKPSLSFYFLPNFLSELCLYFKNYKFGKEVCEYFFKNNKEYTDFHNDMNKRYKTFIEIINIKLNIQPTQETQTIQLRNNELINNKPINNKPIETIQLRNNELINNKPINNKPIETIQLRNNELINNKPTETIQLRNNELINNKLRNNELINNKLRNNELINNKLRNNEQINNKPILCFVADGGWGKWTGRDILTKGIGGSETYIIEMARYIQKLGFFNVFVFCNCEEKDIFEDVNYLHLTEYSSFIMNTHIHSCIISRFVEYIPISSKGNIDNLYLVFHDLIGENTTITNIDKIKKIFCLTEWHVCYFNEIFPIFKNITIPLYYGIDKNNFKITENTQKIKYKFIYSSFPNRGLLQLLELWPIIVNRYPSASLYIYSDVHGKWVNEVSEKDMNLCKSLLELYKKNSNYNINYKGWVDKKTLADSWITSDVWFYPCTFTETFCLTALEAAVTKTLVVTNNLGALQNTVADRGVIIEGDPRTKEWKNNAIYELFSCLDDENKKKYLIEKNYEWSKNISWEGQAKILQNNLIDNININIETKNIETKNIDFFDTAKNINIEKKSIYVKDNFPMKELEYANMENWCFDLPNGNNELDLFIKNLDYLNSKNIKNPKILEVGIYSGTSLIHIINHIPNSYGVGIDLWEDYFEEFIKENEIIQVDCLRNIKNNKIKDIFYKNIEIANLKHRIEARHGDSCDILTQMIINGETFDLIYIDGSHIGFDCYIDLVLSFKNLKKGGIMIIDDVMFNKYDTIIQEKQVLNTPYYSVLHFYEKYKNKLKILDISYRFFLEKIDY